jgi:hypothetical protein
LDSDKREFERNVKKAISATQLGGRNGFFLFFLLKFAAHLALFASFHLNMGCNIPYLWDCRGGKSPLSLHQLKQTKRLFIEVRDYKN